MDEVTVPGLDYRVPPECERIYQWIETAMVIAAADPRIGPALAISVGFSAVIRETIRLVGVERTVAILEQYVKTTPQADKFNRAAMQPPGHG